MSSFAFLFLLAIFSYHGVLGQGSHELLYIIRISLVLLVYHVHIMHGRNLSYNLMMSPS